MSSFGKHGQTGGGGVKRPGGGSPPGPPRSGYGGGSTSPSRDQPDDTVAKHWPDYLEGGYFDESGNLKIQYVSRCLPGDEHLPDHQQRGCEELIYSIANASIPLTTGQMRRFFSHCRALETKIKTGSATWYSLHAEFQKLDSAAADGFGKKPKPKIPGLFYDFIRRNVAAVHSEKDFLQGFLPHFEAIVGFGSLYLKDRN